MCFISTIITHRLLSIFGTAKSLEGISYGKTMRILERAKKVRLNGEWTLIRMTHKDSEVLSDLGLIPHVIAINNPRGRPRKKN